MNARMLFVGLALFMPFTAFGNAHSAQSAGDAAAKGLPLPDKTQAVRLRINAANLGVESVRRSVGTRVDVIGTVRAANGSSWSQVIVADVMIVATELPEDPQG